jgi:tungstate transport system permease protein
LSDIPNSVHRALELLFRLDPALLRIIALSLAVSFSAAAAASAIGLPLGAALAVARFRGRYMLIVLANAMFGLPPVVVGLGLYLLLSRFGPLGMLEILFTPAAMVLAQFLLALPIVVAISHRTMSSVWQEYGDAFLADGLGRLQTVPHVLAIGRLGALTAVLAGLGRSISEVGAILIVGGNIVGYTRTMTTAIALETSEGNFAFALALGGVLVVISITVSIAAFQIEARFKKVK